VMTRIIDISPPLVPGIEVWPGDTPFQLSWASRLEEGSSCNVARLTTTPHVGAHADGPLHFVAEGEAIGAVDLSPYLGRCRVVDVTGARVVDEDALLGVSLGGVERLLFRTGTFPDFTRWNEDFAYFDPVLLRRLGRQGVRLVGIDTPSVDPFHSKDLPAHHALIELGMRNLEGLDLSAADPGDYELIALPLRLMESDSSPVRAVLRGLDEETPSHG
jgi:arylformamidase